MLALGAPAHAPAPCSSRGSARCSMALELDLAGNGKSTNLRGSTSMLRAGGGGVLLALCSPAWPPLLWMHDQPSRCFWWWCCCLWCAGAGAGAGATGAAAVHANIKHSSAHLFVRAWILRCMLRLEASGVWNGRGLMPYKGRSQGQDRRCRWLHCSPVSGCLAYFFPLPPVARTDGQREALR